MTNNPHDNEYEVLFTGRRLRLLRAVHGGEGTARLFKTPVDDAATPLAVSRLTHEYDICRDSDLAGVLRPTAEDTIEGRPAVVFDDPGGVSLAQLLATGPAGLPLFLDVAIELAGIVGRLHRKGIVHKDIHSGNIIVRNNRNPVQVWLTGLGIAVLQPWQSVETTAPDKLEGTLSVMSPEQTGRMNRPVDYRTDFYSLGAVFYQMLAGRLPFVGDDPLRLVHAHLAVNPPAPDKINPDIPPVLSDIVLKLLAKDADERYRSAAGIAADLKRARDDLNRTGGISSFEPARRDVSESFHIPDRLYGREDEIRILQSAFERSCNGPAELVLVAGYAGIGKTELVNRIRRSVFQKNGYFISGKCDPLDRKIPCAPFVAAISEAVDHALALPGKMLGLLRKNMAQALGGQGRVLTDVIPTLSLIIGEQPPVPDLPPDQARNRFHLMLQRLFAAGTLRGRLPMVLFLDDLQWADLSTLKMLEALARDTDLRNVLLIGAYRNREVDESHGLSHTLKEIDATGGRIQTVDLGPMPGEGVRALIADALVASPAGVEGLAALCQKKTGGNPFFLRHFLLELVAKKLIFFNAARNEWQWHTDEIARADVTDNVVELMAGTIGGFDGHVRQVLKTAACIGNQFDLGILCAVHEQPPQTMLDRLWPAVRSGLISVLPVRGLHFAMRTGGTEAQPVIASDADAEQIRFKFVHDRIHEAAYGLMAADKKTDMHLRIGRLMLESCPADQLSEKIYNILGQLNRAVELITEPHERENLVRLNLEAGKKARAMALFESAFHYFRKAISLLDSTSWHTQYELAKEVHIKGMETSAACGRYTEFHQWFDSAEQIRTPCEKINAYIAKMQVENATGRYVEGVKSILDILSRLDIRLPLDPGEAELVAAARETSILVNQFRTRYSDLPILEDPVQLGVQKLLAVCTSSTYYVDPHLKKMTIGKGIDHCIRHGLSDSSAVLLMEYAAYIYLFDGTEKDAYAIGRLALDLLERFENKISEWRLRLLFYVWVLPHEKHFGESVEPLTRAYHEGVEVGDTLGASFNLVNADIFRFFRGDRLPLVVEKMAVTRKVMQKNRSQPCLVMLNLCCQFMMNLMGKSEHPLLMAGDFFDERVVFPNGRPDRNDFFFDIVSFYKLVLSVFFEDFSETNRLAALIEHSVYVENHIYIRSRFLCYSSLSRLAVWETLSSRERDATLEKVVANAQRLQSMAKAAPMNHLHLLHMVEAELARVEGRMFEAQEHFDRAIEPARENGFVYEQALANELAAKFWMGRGKKPFAQIHMREALDCHTRWGAAAKVRDLQEKHPEFFPGERAGALKKTETGSQAPDLDVMSALRASRAISGEIVLDRLVEKLMGVVIENAGATCGLLLLETDGTLYVAAEAAADRPGRITRPEKGVAAEKAGHLLPLQLVQYVQRTGKPVVIEDAATHERFGQDPHILENRPRSVLCSPIARKDNIIGLFYLENNLTTGAFTAERLRVLEILSAQIAVSLENANLYEARRRAEVALKKHRDQLEVKVRARTAELEAAKERAESASRAKSDFLAGMSHELRTPLNAILGYAQIFLRRRPDADLDKGLTTIRQSGEHLLTLINDILDTAKIEAGKVELSPEPVEPDSFLETIIVIVRSRAEKKGLSVRLERPAVLPDAVLVDATRLRQVLLNLMNNAIKFTDRGGVILRVTPRKSVRSADEVRLCFEVTDTGIGIAADQLKRIFIPFEQVSESQRRIEGTGLGLFISNRLVGLMGGELAVESEPGLGSTFGFEINVPSAETVRDAMDEDRRLITGYSGPRRTVLVVDDVETNRDVLVEMLKAPGFAIEEAANGRQALACAIKNPPDLILMDSYMPEMDGLTAIKKMRRINRLKNTPAIAVSASVTDEDRAQILRIGFDGFVPKPVHWPYLAMLVQRHLNLEWQYAEEKKDTEEIAVDAGSLKPPPHEELAVLHELAMMGDMKAIIARASHIETMGAQYSPFARKLRQMAEAFEDERIRFLVKQHRE